MCCNTCNGLPLELLVVKSYLDLQEKQGGQSDQGVLVVAGGCIEGAGGDPCLGAKLAVWIIIKEEGMWW